MNVKIYPSEASGDVIIPCSKSLAHRALIMAALSPSLNIISNITYSKDIDATIDCLQKLGAVIEKKQDCCKVTGTDITKLTGDIVLDCNESGSTLRFLVPIAAMSGARVSFVMHGRLSKRPMTIYEEIFQSQNLLYEQVENRLTIQGPLHEKEIAVPGNISSQFISGLLMGLSLTHEPCTITVTGEYQSKSYVDLTIQVLEEYGIAVSYQDRVYHIPAAHHQSKDIAIEGDWSQAAFFAVLGAIKGNIRCLNMNPLSVQGDQVIVSLLKKAGACISDMTFMHQHLHAQTIDLQDCPDLGPILFVLAAYSKGCTTIIHCERLRIKESDRIEAMETELKKWGVDIQSTEDTVIIQGKSSYQNDTVVKVDGHNDHRIVMAMTIFGLCANSPSIIEGAHAVSKSYPDFFEDIKKVNGNIEYKGETL